MAVGLRTTPTVFRGPLRGDEVPAEPAHHVRFADLLPELGGQRPQHLVADQVAVAVVDPLEVIDVDQQQGQRCPGPSTCHGRTNVAFIAGQGGFAKSIVAWVTLTVPVCLATR